MQAGMAALARAPSIELLMSISKTTAESMPSVSSLCLNGRTLPLAVPASALGSIAPVLRFSCHSLRPELSNSRRTSLRSRAGTWAVP